MLAFCPLEFIVWSLFPFLREFEVSERQEVLSSIDKDGFAYAFTELVLLMSCFQYVWFKRLRLLYYDIK